MAITANVDLGNGATASSCYIIIPNAYVKKFRPEKDGEDATIKLIYDVDIYQNKAAADTFELSARLRKKIVCREVDHFKIDYDVTTTDNPWKLAYTHLKTNSSLSSVSDA
jgi:hypothetical protein